MAKPLRLSFALPFEEAIAAAAARKIVLPEVYYSAAQKAARSITTTVSGLAGLDQITAVIASYREAAAKGEAFGTWKRMAELQNWGLPKGLLETIFRTQIQTEYSAGHWRSFEEHKVRRPYLMWSAINDSRVRPNHLALDGYIAPVGDPFWQTHPVPLGFRCRCSQVSLSDAQAIARGYGRQATPTARPDKGFGEGNPGDAAAAVRRAADRKLTTAPPAARRAFDKFVEKGAEKFVEPTDFIKAGRQITAALPDGATDPRGLFGALMAKLDRDVGVAKPASVASTGAGAKLAREASRRYPNTWTDGAAAAGPLYVRAAKNTRGWAYTVPDAMHGSRVRMEGFGSVQQQSGAGYLYLRSDDIGNAVHEYAHRLQRALPGLDAVFQKAHTQRVVNQPLESLKSVVPNSVYRPDEVTRKDGYTNPYQGKEYTNEPTGQQALEVMPMAFEHVLGMLDAHWTADYRVQEFVKFYTKDRDMFDLVVGLLFKWKP